MATNALATAKRPKAPAGREAEVSVQSVPLSELHFDGSNPRFGGQPLKKPTDLIVLDEIVRRYGVEDVLSSIAANGYLPTEPLVGVKDGNGVRILEGNRRLAALLILAGDPRAANQDRLQQIYRKKAKHRITAPPVVVYDEHAEPAELLPYLGVKHIVGPRVWDSYAKAAWMAGVLDAAQSPMSLENIENMLGDTRGTIRRMLEGYYLVRQLVDTGAFRPEDSVRKGRGSNPDFPFSWVYNALGYNAIRRWLGMEKQDEPSRSPVPKNRVANAGELMEFLFGNEQKGKLPAIAESRQIGELAACLDDPIKVKALRSESSVAKALQKTAPTSARLGDSLRDADEALAEAWDVLGAADLSAEDARGNEPMAGRVRNRASKVHKKLLDAMLGDDGDA